MSHGPSEELAMGVPYGARGYATRIAIPKIAAGWYYSGPTEGNLPLTRPPFFDQHLQAHDRQRGKCPDQSIGRVPCLSPGPA